ncbi:MAG: DUF58 domain-containing protein [Polyangiaceae bacterium]
MTTFRTIDWNVSARMRETYVKVFVEEREMTVMLVVDLSASQGFGTQSMTKNRLAAEVGALCAFSAIRNNDRVGLILSTDEVEKLVPPKKGQKHVMRVVREILRRGAEAARNRFGHRARNALSGCATSKCGVPHQRFLRTRLRTRALARVGSARRHPAHARRSP